jgi:hypothetical protein
MAVFQKETGLCTGRGFADVDATGYLAKFKTWVVKAAGSGGPAWTILLDRSTLPVLTTFTVPDHTNDRCYSVAHGLYTGETVQVSNSGGALPAGLSAATDYYVVKYDADNFRLATTLTNAWAGTVINITGAGTGTHSFKMTGPYIVVSDQAAPTINQSCMILKVGYVTATAAEVRVQMCLSFDTTNKILYGYWSGYIVTTLDSADFSYDFRGGAECMVLQSRIGSSWSNAAIDGWTGDTNFVEGTGATGTLASGATAGSNVVLTLGTGQAANFVANKYYYIYDMNGHAWVNYVKVTATDGAESITVDSINVNFPTGSVIAAYAHRWYTFGSGTNGSLARFSQQLSKIPYCSGAIGYVFGSQDANLNGLATLELPSYLLLRLNPDDLGYQACSKGLLFEWFRENTGGSNTTGMNRAYGSPKNIYICVTNSMAAALDGKTIGAKNYLYFIVASSQFGSGSGTHACLILDTTATS